MQIAGSKILITGGASGIGLGMAGRFVQEEATVIICGRREAALNEAAQKFPGIITRACDLSTEAGRIALYNWIAEAHPDLNVLVNNAGVQQWMNIGDADFYQRAKAEIATNIEAPLHLTALFSGMASLNTILNVTSGLAFVPFTKVPVYSATKAFFHSFTLSVRHLLAAKSIEVIEIIPPALNTDLGGPGLHDAAPPVSAFVEAVFSQLAEGKAEITFGFSEAAAKAGPPEQQVIFNRLNPPPAGLF